MNAYGYRCQIGTNNKIFIYSDTAILSVVGCISPQNDTVPSGAPVILTVPESAPISKNNSFQWQVKSHNHTWMNITDDIVATDDPHSEDNSSEKSCKAKKCGKRKKSCCHAASTAHYKGSQTDSLIITEPNNSVNFYKYRCVFSSSGSNSLVSNEVSLVIKGALSPETNTCAVYDSTYFATVTSDPNVIYQWEVNYGGGFDKISDSIHYRFPIGTKLFIKKAMPFMNDAKFRCIIRDSFTALLDTSNTANLCLTGSIASQKISIDRSYILTTKRNIRR